MKDEAPPRVSVIVPVRNRRDLLAAALRALDDQAFESYEVIVVDDGSDDGTRELAEAAFVHDRPVRVLDSSGAGAVAARTIGVEHARAPYLAFTDSDCIPEPGWLAAGVGALDAGADLVHGPTIPTRDAAPLERTLWSATEGLFPTCNVFYRRSAFETAGGFDRHVAGTLSFRVDRRAKGLGFGEDTILAWRLSRSGAKVAFVPDARVGHHVFGVDVRESVSRTLMVAAFPGLVREVPELRRTLLQHGLFLGSPVRAPLYLALISLLRGHRRSAAVAGAGWVIAEWLQLRKTAPVTREARLQAFPMVLALDALTAGALVAGSLRHRRVVL